MDCELPDDFELIVIGTGNNNNFKHTSYINYLVCLWRHD